MIFAPTAQQLADHEATPHWSPVDGDTADLLALVADKGHVSADHEWREFNQAVWHVARRHGGLVDQNHMRPLLRGVVAPRRIGSFYRRACLEGLLRPTGDWTISDDTEGRNAGRPVKLYALDRDAA